MIVAVAWTLINLVGLSAGIYILREAHLDYRAARSERRSDLTILHVAGEGQRTQSFRVMILLAFSVVGLLAVAIPETVRPTWLQTVIRLLLLGGALLVTADAILAARSKRRLIELIRTNRTTGTASDRRENNGKEQ